MVTVDFSRSGGRIVLGQRPSRIYRHRLPAQNPRAIREYYDRLSRSYGILYGPEQAMKHEKVLAIMEERMYSVFVDIGCGDGMLLSKVRGRSCLQVGLDFSLRMLEEARCVLGESGNLVRGDARHLPFRDGVTDCIVSISLSDRGNIETLASEVARIARYDATVLLSVIHPDGSLLTKFPGLKLLDRCLLSTRETLLVLSKHRPMLKNEWRRMDGGR